MQTTPSKPAFWIGWILSAIPAGFLLSGSVTAWMGLPQVTEGMTHLGYPVSAMHIIGTLEFLCAILYIIPAPRSSEPSCSPPTSAEPPQATSVSANPSGSPRSSSVSSPGSA